MKQTAFKMYRAVGVTACVLGGLCVSAWGVSAPQRSLGGTQQEINENPAGLLPGNQAVESNDFGASEFQTSGPRTTKHPEPDGQTPNEDGDPLGNFDGNDPVPPSSQGPSTQGSNSGVSSGLGNGMTEEPEVATEPIKEYSGSLGEGLIEMQRLATEETIASAEDFSKRLLVPRAADRAQLWLDQRLSFLGSRGAELSHGLIRFLGMNPRSLEAQAVVHYDLGVLQVDQASTEEARASFETAIYLAEGETREKSIYNLGTIELILAESLFDKIPEVHGRTRSAMSPGFVAGPTPTGEEEPDYLKMSRTVYKKALGHYTDRLAIDWKDADTRANVEWVQRRMEELREIEEKRKSDEGQGMAQDDPSAGEGEDEEQQASDGEKGAESEEKSEEEQQQQTQDGESPEDKEGQDKDRKDEEQEEEKDGEEKDDQSDSEEEGKEEPEERIFTEEEIKRLLKGLEQHDKEGERLRDMVRRIPQGRAKKDW